MKCYCWTQWRTCRLDHTSATYNFPNIGHQVGATFGDKMGGSKKWCEEDKTREYDGGARNTVVEKINYNHHLSLIQTLPTSSTRSPPQPHTNNPIAELMMHRTLPRCPDNNSPHKGDIIKPNQCETPKLIHNGIHTPILDPTKTIIKPSKTCINISQHLHSSLISIGKLCDDECIVTFDKHKFIVSKNKDIIIEGYWDPKK